MTERDEKKIAGIRIGEVPGGRMVRRVYKGQRKPRAAEPEYKAVPEPEQTHYVSEVGKQMPKQERDKYDRLLRQKHEDTLRGIVKEILAGVPNAEEILRECDKIGWNNMEKINEIVDKALEEIREEPSEPSEENIFATETYDGAMKDYDKIQEDIEHGIFNILTEENDGWDDDDEDEEDEDDDEDEGYAGNYPSRGFMYADFRPDPATMDGLGREERMKYMSAMELFRHTSEVLVGSRGDIYSQSQGFSRMFDDALAAAGGLISGEFGSAAAEQAVMWANSVSRYGVLEHMQELYCRYIMDTVRYKMLYGDRIDEPYKEAMEIIAEMVRRS